MIARLARVMLIVVSCLMGTAFGQSDTVKIIVHSDVHTTEFTTSQLRRIFSMRQSVWPNGQPVVVYVLQTEHPTHKSLCKDVLKMFPYQMEKLWNKLAFSGVSDTPIEVRTEAEMLEKLRATPGAIGYTTLVAEGDDLRVVALEGGKG